MQARDLPDVKIIAAYLRNMRFDKKWFGGCQKENVLDHFAEVTQRYTDIIDGLLVKNEAQEQQIVSLQAQLKQMQHHKHTTFAERTLLAPDPPADAAPTLKRIDETQLLNDFNLLVEELLGAKPPEEPAAHQVKTIDEVLAEVSALMSV